MEMKPGYFSRYQKLITDIDQNSRYDRNHHYLIKKRPFWDKDNSIF